MHIVIYGWDMLDLRKDNARALAEKLVNSKTPSVEKHNQLMQSFDDFFKDYISKDVCAEGFLEWIEAEDALECDNPFEVWDEWYMGICMGRDVCMSEIKSADKEARRDVELYNAIVSEFGEPDILSICA